MSEPEVSVPVAMLERFADYTYELPQSNEQAYKDRQDARNMVEYVKAEHADDFLRDIEWLHIKMPVATDIYERLGADRREDFKRRAVDAVRGVLYEIEAERERSERRVIVLARDYRQACNWAREHGILPGTAEFVYGTVQLEGRRITESTSVVELDGFWDHPSSSRIWRTLVRTGVKTAGDALGKALLRGDALKRQPRSA